MPDCERSSGILLHVSSLPSAFGIGDLGPASFRFVDLLARHKQHYWSILPLTPARLQDGNSPYQTSSAFAGNTLLISPEKLAEDGLLPKVYLTNTAKSLGRVDYRFAYAQKMRLVEEAYGNFKKSKISAVASSFTLEDFCAESWVDDYALYCALRKKAAEPWYSWPSAIRRREKWAVAEKQQAFREEVELQKFAQYLFFSQWHTLRNYCQAKQVRVIGDMPFYVAYDSADVWVNPELFKLNTKGKPRFVSGVPPDYFSSNGQLWGNPVYNWKKMSETDFKWWINRIRHSLKMYDKLRLDHFRGFVAYWQVPASAATAKDGRWVKACPQEFLDSVKTAFPSLPFIAEDLGVINEPVRQTIGKLGIPGMRVLVFAFDGDKNNPHLPRNHPTNSVVLTGTHDTNTVRGWFVNEATAKERQNVFRVIGRKVSAEEVPLEMVKLAQSSVAKLSIIPFQDVLSLGSKARMNNPSKSSGNWEWRVTSKQLANKKLEALADVTTANGRAN